MEKIASGEICGMGNLLMEGVLGDYWIHDTVIRDLILGCKIVVFVYFVLKLYGVGNDTEPQSRVLYSASMHMCIIESTTVWYEFHFIDHI